MIWQYSVCVSPLQVARPLRYIKFRTTTNTLPIIDAIVFYCERSDIVAYLWKPFKSLVFRISRIAMRAFYFVASDPCCTNSPTDIFPDWYAFHILFKDFQQLYVLVFNI